MKRIIIVVFLFAFSSVSFGQLNDDNSDPRVRKILNELGYNFMVVKSNESEYRLEFKLSNGRKQVGFIDSQTSFYGNFEVREVMSLVYVGPNLPSQLTLYGILKRNSEMKIGAFEMFYNGTNYVIRFTARISANLDSAGIDNILTLVLNASDKLEKELTDDDDN